MEHPHKTVADVLAAIDQIAPFETAADWDHVGLQVGSPSQAVTRALVCLDITPAAIQAAKENGAQLLVSHHPVIFQPITALSPEHPVYSLAALGFSAIAAHTNWDMAAGGVNETLARTLNLQHIRPSAEPFVWLGELADPTAPADFAAHCARTLGVDVRLKDGREPLSTVAVCGGAGGEFASAAALAGAQALVTGEIHHHEYLAAAITLIEAGHAATEQPAVQPLCQALQERLPDIQWMVFEGEKPYQAITVQ